MFILYAKSTPYEKTSESPRINSLGGTYREGAEFWAGQRNAKNQVSCGRKQGGQDNDYKEGCLDAKKFLTRVHQLCKSDRDYCEGWNSL